MLNEEENLRLIKLAQNGDKTAKDLLIEHNSPLVKSIVKRFKNKNIEYEDLYQIGCIGFIKAIKNFNDKFNVKFSTYVVPMVMGEIKRFLRDDGYIKVSRNIKTLNLQIKKFIDQYIKENNQSPTYQVLSEKFNIDERELVFIMDSSKMPISIYTPLEQEENGVLLVDRFVNQDENENLITKLLIKEALSSLPAREKRIVIMRYFRDKTQSETAKILNISQVQVSRLENKVLATLKEKLTCD